MIPRCPSTARAWRKGTGVRSAAATEERGTLSARPPQAAMHRGGDRHDAFPYGTGR